MNRTIDNYTIGELKNLIRNQGLSLNQREELIKSFQQLLSELNSHITLVGGIRPTVLMNRTRKVRNVNDIYNKVKNGFSYIISEKEGGHSLDYVPKTNGYEPVLTELVRVHSGVYAPDYRNQSILRNLFGSNAMPTTVRGIVSDGPNYVFENPTVDQVKEVLNVLVNRPDFDEAKLVIH